MASPRRYRVRNSVASLFYMRIPCTYAYIEKIKFSTSLCLPEKVNGFSYFILLGYTTVTGCYYGYGYTLGPASATGTYDSWDNVYYYTTYYYKSSYDGVVLCTPNYESIPLLLVCDTYCKYSYNRFYASAAIY